MPSAGDLAALLGGARARVRTAHAVIRDWTDPFATLESMKNGPWADAITDDVDPGMFGLPDEPTAIELRQWVDYERNRFREERGEVVNIKDGPRWWSVAPGLGVNSGAEPASSLELCDALKRWTDPQPLARLMELEPAGETEALGRAAWLVTATARGDNAIAAEIAPLGWSADRWELTVDAERGVLLATAAFVGDKPFRRVEALTLELDQPFDDTLFTHP
ncbi:MAG TPA: hypothetical protein VFZ00_32275 [Solirubrobacter sp.]|nr:hypothetical protein [Solirubrobacter sp.]